MPEFLTSCDPAIKRRLASLGADFSGRVTLFYESGRMERAEISESLRTRSAQTGAASPIPAIEVRSRLESLAPTFYGRAALVYQDGDVVDLEITESIKPAIDRRRAAFAK